MHYISKILGGSAKKEEAQKKDAAEDVLARLMPE